MVRYSRHEVYNREPLCMGMCLIPEQVPEQVSEPVLVLIAVLAPWVQVFLYMGMDLVPERVSELASGLALELTVVLALVVRELRCMVLLAAAVLPDYYFVLDSYMPDCEVYLLALVLTQQGAAYLDFAC